MKKISITIALMFCISCHAGLDIKNGFWLRNGVDSISAMKNGKFTQNDEARAGLFIGYIAAATDALVITNTTCKLGGYVDREYTQQIIMSYVSTNPGIDQLPAYIIVSNALKPLMNCSK